MMNEGRLAGSIAAGTKRAALRLALLSAADRQWLLDRLDPEQRAAILGLMPQLQRLDLARVRGLGRELDVLLTEVPVRAAPVARLPAEEPVKDHKPVRQLDSASTEELSKVLRQMPPECAQLLAERMQPSRRHVIDALLPVRTGQRAQARVVDVTPAFVDLLAEVVEESLARGRQAAVSANGTAP